MPHQQQLDEDVRAGEQPTPGEPKQPPAEPKHLPAQPASPVNPDPKAHPIHAPIPMQPINPGTDPKRPVTAES